MVDVQTPREAEEEKLRDTIREQQQTIERMREALRGACELIYSAGDLADSPQYAKASAALEAE